MKGIILAGGTATRLFPLTTTTSKQLLPVYDRQMIFYPLNTLIKAGIREILIIVAPEQSGQFLNLLGPIFEHTDIRIEFRVQSVPRGLADAFIVGESFIAGDNVAMILGDNIFEDDFSDAIKTFRKGGKIFALKVRDWQRYGIVKFDKDMHAVQIEEKPKEWISDYAIPGLYIYDSRVSSAAKEAKPSARGEIEITELHNWYLSRGELEVSLVKGAWLDAGTFDTLLEAGMIVKERGIAKNFDPRLVEAIARYNENLKSLAKKKLL